MKNILGLLFLGLLFVAFQEEVDAKNICIMRQEYRYMGGYCFQRGVGKCGGAVIKRGCRRKCSLCVPEQPGQSYCQSLGGYCLQANGQQVCNGILDPPGCGDPGCHCCVPTAGKNNDGQ
ncbi:uncharacterized protein LOC135222888 [Macrobrachium nipponense]|uniref:uncharacterized protein LOC135222888 n=1 Tax=Macrobrachium nipponense TaxID=159736 RepID=UPI0030C812BB